MTAALKSAPLRLLFNRGPSKLAWVKFLRLKSDREKSDIGTVCIIDFRKPTHKRGCRAGWLAVPPETQRLGIQSMLIQEAKMEKSARRVKSMCQITATGWFSRLVSSAALV